MSQPKGLRILLAMQALNKHIYAGTVPAKVKAKRRAAGKRTKAARKVNR